jgi:hypothetical protein
MQLAVAVCRRSIGREGLSNYYSTFPNPHFSFPFPPYVTRCKTAVFIYVKWCKFNKMLKLG